MVYIRAGFDERASKINFGPLAGYGVCEGCHSNNVFDVHREAARYEVVEGILVFEFRIRHNSLCTGNKERSVAKLEWCFRSLQIWRCSRFKLL